MRKRGRARKPLEKWLVVSLPFSDYSLTTLFEIPESPPLSQDGLKALLEHIVYASNVSMLSAVLL